MEIPVSTRSMDRPMASAMATERLRWMTLPGIAPALTLSICFSSTPTAGSAEMMNQPSTMASGTSSQPCTANSAPSSAPSGEKPTFTPVRNRTRPT